MNKITLISFLFFTSFITSCNDEIDESGLISEPNSLFNITDALKLKGFEPDAIIEYDQYSYVSSPVRVKEPYLTCLGKNINTKLSIPTINEELHFRTTRIRNESFLNGGSLNVLKGGEIDISLEFDNINKKFNLYVPLEFHSALSIEDSPMEVKPHEEINRPFTISWNQDSNNSKGVIVDFGWYHLESKTGSRSVVVIEDSKGKYTLSNTFFDSVPKGALIDVTLRRGSYVKLENMPDDRNYLAVAQAKTSISVKKQ